MPANFKAALVAVAVAGLTLSGCAADDTTSDPRTVRVAMVSDVGGLGDRSFNDSAYAGLRAAKHRFGDEIAVLQSMSGADYKSNLDDLAGAGYDEIIAIGFLMQEDITAAARAYPKKHFAIIDAVVDAPNVASVTFREEQGSFLAGAAAELASKTHHLAFIGGVDIPLLRKFEVGFIAGAREIDPAARVDVRYVGSFDDEAAGKRISADLYAGGADVIFVAAGRANIGAIETVKTLPDRFVIGVDSGPMHLAAALSKPGAAIFGPTDPARNGPYGGSLQVLRSPRAKPMSLARGNYRRGNTIDDSMRDITPDQVIASLSQVFAT